MVVIVGCPQQFSFCKTIMMRERAQVERILLENFIEHMSHRMHQVKEAFL